QDITSQIQLNKLILDAGAANGFVVNGSSLQFAGSGALLQRQINDTTAAALVVNAGITFGVNTTLDAGSSASGQFYHLILGGRVTGGGTVTNSSSTGAISFDTLFRGRNGGLTGTYVNSAGITYAGAENVFGRDATVDLGTPTGIGTGLR